MTTRIAKSGDLVKGNIEVGLLYLCDENNIVTHSISPSNLGLVLHVDSKSKLNTQVLMGGKIGWCNEHALKIIQQKVPECSGCP